MARFIKGDLSDLRGQLLFLCTISLSRRGPKTNRPRAINLRDDEQPVGEIVASQGLCTPEEKVNSAIERTVRPIGRSSTVMVLCPTCEG
jgi:hypothetical protein